MYILTIMSLIQKQDIYFFINEKHRSRWCLLKIFLKLLDLIGIISIETPVSIQIFFLPFITTNKIIYWISYKVCLRIVGKCYRVGKFMLRKGTAYNFHHLFAASWWLKMWINLIPAWIPIPPEFTLDMVSLKLKKFKYKSEYMIC